MKFEDVVALAKAGYTADQIAKMAPLADKQQPTAPDVQQPAAQIEQPAPAVQPDPILAALEKLTNAVQANGIMRAEQPAEPSEEEILASIIMPTRKGD
jgi:hypothetical protein